MSEESLDGEKKVVVNQEDIKNIEDFFNHFRITIPEYLSAQLKQFKESPSSYTYENQQMLRAELAHTLVESDHELFKDELFKNVIDNCDKVWYEAQFNRDLESVLSEGQDSSESSVD